MPRAHRKDSVRTGPVVGVPLAVAATVAAVAVFVLRGSGGAAEPTVARRSPEIS